jgi:hypothetical protein
MKVVFILLLVMYTDIGFAKAKRSRKKVDNTPVKLSAEAQKRKDILDEMHKICMVKFPRPVDKRKLTCDCLTRNFNQKLDTKDLVILLADYKTSDERKKLPPKEDDPNEALFMFNIDVSEACIKNPKWKIGDPE